MRRLPSAFAAGLFLSWCLAGPADAQSAIVTLQDVVKAALANNRDLALAQRDVDKASEQIEVVRTNRLPHFNVNFLDPIVPTDLALRLGPLGTLGLPHNFAFLIGTASQPISQLRDIALGIKASELSRDLASERLRAARQTVVDEIKRGYYGCQRAQSGLKPSREAVDLFIEIERVVGTQVDERAALESDRLEVQARRAQQEHDVLVLENALATCKERLNVALARDPDAPIEFEPIPATLPDEADVTAALARVIDGRPEVRQARITIDLARTDLRLKRAEQMPRVSALFAYVGTINMPLLPGSIASAVISASWEPFDWGRKSRERATRQIAIDQAELRLRQVEATVTIDLHARARAVRESRSLVAVAALGERAARERVRVMLDKHSETAVLTKDLLQAQVALADAAHKYQAALLAYWEARADFEKAAAVDQ